MENNSVQSFELKRKIADVSSVDMEAGARISDYVGNTGFVIDNADIYVGRGLYSEEHIRNLKNEFLKVTERIMAMGTLEVVDVLNKTRPDVRGTEANIASIKEIFIH